MCGIGGFVTPCEVPPDLIHQRKKSLASTLLERGPDSQGEHILGSNFFLHTRLGIQDISNPLANQPFSDSRHILCFNGEIYNHASLRSTYLANVDFRTSSDTETLFYFLSFFPVEFVLSRLNGIFAFSFYDISSQILYLCRDHLGIKPLFYAHNLGSIPSISFCSYASGLAKSAQIPLKLDPDALYNFFLLGSVWSESTLFSGIKQLPHGSYLSYNLPSSSISISSYRYLADTSHSLSSAIAQEKLSDCPTSLLLSGGVDSSVLSLLLSPDASIHLASAESTYAEHVSAISNSKILYAQPDNQDYDHILFEYSLKTGHCSASAVIPYITASVVHDHGFRVVFSANGADELFYGYPRIPAPSSFPPRFQFTDRYEPDINKSAEVQSRHIFRSFDKLKPLILGKRCTSPPPSYPQVLAQFNAPEGAERRFELDTYVSGDLNITLDHAFMLHSIEARVPFLNQDVLALASRIPYSDCVDSEFGRKAYLKKILVDHCTSNLVWNRPKIGFSLPSNTVALRRRSTLSKLRDLSDIINVKLDFSTRDGLYLESAIHAFWAWKKAWIDSGMVSY